GRVEFEQTYASAPIVVLIPSTSFDSRDRWAITPDDADKGTGTLPMPSPAQIVMRATAQVTASGFEAFCRLIARGTPVQRQTSFAAPTTLSAIGSSSGAATPSSGQVPSVDDTYTAVFDVIVTNDHPTETVDISIQIALDVSMDNGAWVEAQVVWINASAGPGEIARLLDQQITATATGLAGGNDRFRLRIKNLIVIGPSGPSLIVLVNVKRLEWWQDSGAMYASMTPGGTLDAVQFFVISQG